MEQARKTFLAALGSGEIASEQSRKLFKDIVALATSRKELAKAFDGLANRGERLVKQVRRSKQAERAVSGAKQATRQIKGAYTSIRKAFGAEQQQVRKAS